MPAATLLPDPHVLRLDALSVQSGLITMAMTAVQPDAPCPGCGQRSHSIHSRYSRTIADLPWAEIPVRLQLRVRRFFCRNLHCDQAIFTERLPTVVAPWARRSVRLAEHQRHLGLDFGGKAASRAATRLGLPASPDTVLREVRRAPRLTPPTPRVLGVDDWAWRKGQTYGTILIDLETHRPVDLLPDRSADSLAQWLKDHPGVQIISRDRSGAYGDGAARGAPQALQVADRFHLLSNLREALEGVLTRHQAEVCAALSPPACPGGTSVEETADPDQQASDADGVSQKAKITTTQVLALPSTRRRLRAEQQMATNRARRLARYEQVIALHRQGVSQKVMAARLGLCPKTLRRWLRAGGFPERAVRRKRVTRLEPYTSYLHQRWESGCHNGAQLWRELCQQGYLGSRTLVAEWAAQRRRGEHAVMVIRPTDSTEDCRQRAMSGRVRSPRQVSWLLMRAAEALDREEHTFLDCLLLASPSIASAYRLAQQFRQMVKTRQAASLDIWLEAVAESDLPELQRFEAGLRRDYAAVVAGLSLPWSNGPVEGQINRLKFIKRQGYGRAGFDLLKRRVLAA